LGLLIALLAICLCGMDTCQSNPERGERITLGKVLRTLGGEDDPVRLYVMEYKQGGAGGQMWIATAESSRVRFGVSPSRGGAQPLGDLLGSLATRDHVAINGGFYDEKGPLGLVVARGKSLKALRRDGGSGVFTVRNRIPAIVHRDDYSASSDEDCALQSIDRLVDAGRPLVKPRKEMAHDARSAVALDGLGTVYLVVLFDERSVESVEDGRVHLNQNSTETGTTLFALAEFLARPLAEGGLEVQTALNLDGGFSSSMQACIGGECAGVVAFRQTINALVATGASIK
jgi:uncharacterized protein YigE (DUF2233 family)